MYNIVDEWPYVNHQPGECKCTNGLSQYRRDGRTMWLCTNCTVPSDEPVS